MGRGGIIVDMHASCTTATEGAEIRGGDPGTEGVRCLSNVNACDWPVRCDLDLERTEGVLTFNRLRRGSLLSVSGSGSS